MIPKDEELLYLDGLGDIYAIKHLEKKYRPLTKKFIFHYQRKLRTSCELKDLEQYAFMALHNAVKTYQKHKGVSFNNYYRIVMERLIFNRLRKIFSEKNRGNNEAYSYDNVVGDKDGVYFIEGLSARKDEVNYQLSFKEFKAQIEEVLKEVSKQQRQVYELKMKGFTYEEIAQTCGISYKKVDNHLQAVKRKIRLRLTNN